jgi:hypothetical protein
MRMSTKRKMPYRKDSDYAKLFEFWQKKPGQRVTVAEMIAEGERFGMTFKQAKASSSVVMSKSKEKFGNMSAGTGYYGVSVWKKGEPMRKQLVWRKEGEAEPAKPVRNIKPVAIVASEKIAVKATVKPVKAATKGKVTA